MRYPNFMRTYWKPATEAAGLAGLTFHALRHAAGTLAAQLGATIRELMQFLGHSSPRAAMIYQHAASERAYVIADRITEQVRVERDGEGGKGT